MTEYWPALLYLLKNLLNTACLFCVGRFLFGFPFKKRCVLPAALLLLLAAAAAVTVAPLGLSEEDRRMLADAFSFVLCVSFPLSLTLTPRHSALTCLGAALVLGFTADTLYSLVADIAGDALWWESVFTLALYALLLCFLIYAGKHGRLSSLQGAFRTVPKGAWAALLFFEFTSYYRVFGNMYSWYRVFSAISVIAVLLTLFFLIFKLLRFSEQQNTLLARLETQKEYGERLQRSDEELRAFRHDYKNHLIVVRSYLESGNVEAAKAYFDSINELSPEALRKVSTGNFAADALISYKLRAAEGKGVSFCFEGHIPPGGMRDEDLCAILSNLLDNAVEAAAPLEGEKNVHIEAVSRNGFLLLCVTNPTAGATSSGQSGRRTNNSGVDLPATTKADKKNHGYGLKNVRKAARKYGGNLTTESGEHMFSANVMIKLGTSE